MRFEKYLVNETVTSAATNMELAIVQSWNNEKLKNPEFSESAANIVKLLKKEGVNGKAKHWGNDRGPLSSDWKNWGVSNTTPKTDLTIGKFDISLKKEGQSQLVSGGKAETTALFKTALENEYVKKEIDSYIKEVESIFNNMVKFQSDYSVGDLRKVGTPDIDITKIDKTVNEMNKKLVHLLSTSYSFRSAIVFEAASGLRKFDGSFATASHILVFGEDGSWIKLNSLEDPNYIAHLANKTKMNIRYKSTKSRGKYNIYSALRMDTKTLKEELEKYDGEVLTEGKVKDIFSKVAAKVKQYWSNLKSWLKESVHNLLDFLGIDINLSIGSTAF